MPEKQEKKWNILNYKIHKIYRKYIYEVVLDEEKMKRIFEDHRISQNL